LEGKKEKFERLAEKRMSDVIKKMRLIGNLSNQNNYEYSDLQVKQIIDSLEQEIKIIKNRFKDEQNKSTSAFKFKK
jgi:ABC-type Fe3+-hydroxamate transport system substrate-binding protein